MHMLAYLAGVLSGDGWCTRLTIGLRVIDADFAQAFALALHVVFGLAVSPRRDERGYWLVRVGNKTGRFNHLPSYEPTTDEERAAWVRGLFDSEGNAQLRPSGISTNSFGRRVAIYSTNEATLQRAMGYLALLSIPTTIRAQKLSASHKGTRPVYELSVKSGRENYARFACLVGSSIARKDTTLQAIPRSYVPDRTAHARAAQLLGAAAKHRRTMEITLPSVVAGVRDLIAAGIKPTQRNCRAIPGYNTIQRHIAQAALMDLASREP